MKISIFGLGYVGAVSLACLARDRHEVIGVDIDPWKLDLIRSGRTPIIEAGMDTLMAAAVASGRVQVTDDAASAVRGSELSFLCVGTPSRPNGSQDLRALERLAAQLGDALRAKAAYHVFVVRSTVADPAKRKAFDEWYHREHLPDAVKAFGVKKAWRFWTSASSPSSCARAPRYTTMTTRPIRSSADGASEAWPRFAGCSSTCRAR